MSDRVLRFLVKEGIEAVGFALLFYGLPRIDWPPWLPVAGVVAAGAALGLAVRWYGSWAGRVDGLPWHRVGLRLTMLPLAAVAVTALMFVHPVAALLGVAIVVREAEPVLTRAVRQRRRPAPTRSPIPRPRAAEPARVPAER